MCFQSLIQCFTMLLCFCVVFSGHCIRPYVLNWHHRASLLQPWNTGACFQLEFISCKSFFFSLQLDQYIEIRESHSPQTDTITTAVQ